MNVSSSRPSKRDLIGYATSLLFLACLTTILGTCKYSTTGKSVFYVYHGKRVRMLDAPMTWKAKCDFPADEIEQVRDGFEYWNRLAGARLFKELRCAQVARVVVSKRPPEKGEEKYAALTYRNVAFGYMRGANVVFITSWFGYSEDFRKTVARHEAGHVLGMAHHEDPLCIMYPHSNFSYRHPQEACESEKIEFLDVYSHMIEEQR